jgi:hypothetical protein
MNRSAQLKTIAKLERKVCQRRRALKASKPGELLFRAPLSMWSENDIVVEAEGDGAAWLLVVDGNSYPVDPIISSSKLFKTEEEACDAADELVRSFI